MMRAVADVARAEGFDLSDVDTKAACLEVFAMGGPTDQDDAAETGYYMARGFATQAMNQLSGNWRRSPPARAPARPPT